MMLLKEGIYEIPDNCTAVYSERKVIVKSKKRKSDILTCRYCKHQKLGRKCMQQQWWDSFYCEVSPKVIGGMEGYFYSANSCKKACEKFERKEDEK